MIPATVVSSLTAFQAAVAAAKPISGLTPYQLAVLVAQGQSALNDIDGALTATNATLDALDPTGYPLAIIADIRSRKQASADATALSDMRGYVGRALLNLAQGVA